MSDVQLLRASSSTDSKKLASSIITHYESNAETPIVVRSIGAGALNQAVKAVIIANKFFVRIGIVLHLAPAFQDIPGEDITSVQLTIKYHKI